MSTDYDAAIDYDAVLDYDDGSGSGRIVPDGGPNIYNRLFMCNIGRGMIGTVVFFIALIF